VRERAKVCREINGLLAQSWLTTKEHAQLWQFGRQLASALSAETLALDAAEDQQQRRTEMSSSWSAASEGERQLASSRAAFVIELLKLEGVTDVRELEQPRKSAEDQPLESKSWDDLRRQLREAWVRVHKNQPDQDRE
jgi:hypothetical protein